MDKDAALERLDAIEKEASELRKIIEKRGLVYNNTKNYVAITEYGSSILTYHDGEKARFHNFIDCEFIRLERDTPQEAIDAIFDYGYIVYEFSDKRQAIRFLLDNLKD